MYSFTYAVDSRATAMVARIIRLSEWLAFALFGAAFLSLAICLWYKFYTNEMGVSIAKLT